MLFKGKTDQFVVSGFEEMKCINISHHDHLELTKNLSINDSEIIINSLEEDHMVDMNVEWVSNSSQSINTIFRNVFHDLIYLLPPAASAPPKKLEKLRFFNVFHDLNYLGQRSSPKKREKLVVFQCVS